MSFRLIEKIGEGKFANIYKVEDKEENTYAFKMVEAKKLKYIELDILSRLYSPYLIRISDPKIINLNGEGFLEDLKEDNLTNLNINKLPYIQLKRIIISCVYGLRCMHRKGFLHLDISRSNILYSKDNEENYLAYLSDFGWSVRCDDAYKGIISTKVIKYKNTPVEALEGENEGNTTIRRYSDKSDIWSLGIVILELLGSKFDFVETGEYVRKVKNIKDSYIEEKIRLYNNNKMSNYEELKLKELLINMLKINTKERISSRDIHRLSFFSSNNRLLNLTEECVLEKPTEMVFLPYVSPKTTLGIKKIRNHYYINSKINKCITIEEYFLAIQIYLRLMSKANPYLQETEFDDLVNEALGVAKNYYDRSSYGNGNYSIAKKLNAEIGYNFYYSADYLDDLIILNYFLLEGNIDLLGFYNLINIEKIFNVFRERYTYSDKKRNSVSLDKFLELEVPNKKDDVSVNFLSNLDYHEIVSEDTEEDKLVENYKNTEKNFRSDIIDNFEDRIVRKYSEEDIDVIAILDKMIEKKKYIDNYKNLKPNLVNKNISRVLKNINNYFNYDIIEIDIYGNVKVDDKSLYEKDLSYFLVLYRNRYSLLHREGLEGFTHYYSENNNYLKEYLKSKNFKYKNNFDYGINTCCKILEICLIYVIYYNLKNDKKDFHLKCLDYSTVKTIILILSI